MKRLNLILILLCLALLLIAGASYFEFQAFATGYTAGDYAGPDTQEARQWIRELRHEENNYTAEAVACSIFASLCLGTALRRRGHWKQSVALYIGAFLVCPLVAILSIYLVLRL